jgi:hypothetical protein
MTGQKYDGTGSTGVEDRALVAQVDGGSAKQRTNPGPASQPTTQPPSRPTPSQPTPPTLTIRLFLIVGGNAVSPKELTAILATLRRHWNLIVQKATVRSQKVTREPGRFFRLEVSDEPVRSGNAKQTYGVLDFPIYLLENGPDKLTFPTLEKIMEEHAIPRGADEKLDRYRLMKEAWAPTDAKSTRGASAPWTETPYSYRKCSFVNSPLIRASFQGHLDHAFSHTILHEWVHAAFGDPTVRHEAGTLFSTSPPADAGSVLYPLSVVFADKLFDRIRKLHDLSQPTQPQPSRNP